MSRRSAGAAATAPAAATQAGGEKHHQHQPESGYVSTTARGPAQKKMPAQHATARRQPTQTMRSRHKLEVPDSNVRCRGRHSHLEVAPDPLTVTEVGLSEQAMCALAEADLQARPTVPLKPATDSRTICEVAGCPGAEAVAETPKL